MLQRIKIMKTIKGIIKDSIQRDIVTLLTVSIVVGSLLASSVSMAANSYFSKTLANLVGDYGEYDLVIQVREEMKEDTAVQVNKIVTDVFPGGKVSQGPTVTGKSYFYVTLPDQYKTKQVYEDLPKTFGSIPGGASVGMMTEPRLNIRGVPEGAKNMLIDRIMQMDGVRFAFRDGSTVGVILTSLDKSPAVSTSIKNILKDYQVIEITFPVGSEPANPVRLGESIADAMHKNLRLDYAQNVSVDGKNDDMAYMVSTMIELKRFLSAYASQMTLTPAAGVQLAKGDIVVFQGSSSQPLQAGQPVGKDNVTVEITNVAAGGTAEGRIMQGDASQLANTKGYKLEKDVVGSPVAAATYKNPRQELGSALSETGKLVGQIPGFAQDAKSMSQIALGALDNYGNSIDALTATLSGLSTAGTTIQSATSALAGLDTSGIRSQLDNSSRTLGGMANTLQVLRLVNGDVSSTIDSLTSTQQNLSNLSAGLASLDNVAGNARRAKSTIDNIVANGQTTLGVLRAFDVQGTRNSLNDVNARLDGLQAINVPAITAQVQYLASAVPNLKDEEINHSINLLDKFIAGQVIPGARIQILTTSNIAADAVAPIVYAQVGHNNVSLYSTALGVIEPNARGELYQVLNEVKSILAGMTAIIVTILFLVLDHTAIMTVIRRKRLAKKVPVAGWRKLVERLTIAFTAPERRYGAGVGAVMLTAMFVLAGGGIPYLPWIGVPVIGALLGLTVAAYTEKISPIAGEEVLAGEALGLSVDEIMREIVIPNGRPGLMQKLNQRKVKFK
ncbi:hypothetical protein [Sporomusa acidovorans]|uniref:Chromosome partition protein Smc n=1 Tax=Sporomusa acidovorans (strain ATCC 49682 / DSM 3132 / Mol) TaxID=1123286 RepID=A0ABZ3J842_SPOA4|nr:hypothetical protein [Sporomusa acidovorans]OZC19291.1 hypothetical protein SPACI_28810 [Sporomusa acidovorans DSM 3132]SDD81736.1 hypothetical protein SAMN04488499_1004137 [Sporomusa acidovorans]